MITYFSQGDIFNIPNIFNYAHGCNCAGAMGKGIALQFRERFPQMYKEYKQLCQTGNFKVGSVFLYKTDNGWIFNLGTQESWKTKAQLQDIKKSIETMFSLARQNHISKIALPKIGAGLGGLNWEEVKQIIEQNAKEYPNIDLFIVENYKDSENDRQRSY